MKRLVIIASIFITLLILTEKHAIAEQQDGIYLCGDYEYLVREDGKAEICRYTGTITDIAVPEQLDDHEVVVIRQKAFEGNTFLRTVSIPSTVNTISRQAFENCAGLQEITFSEGLLAIGDFSFYECRSLISVSLPASLDEIGIGVFCGCILLEDIHVAEDNPRFGVYNHALFSKEDKMLIGYAPATIHGLLTIPEGTRIIGPNVFTGCKNISEICFPESLRWIKDNAFDNSSVETVLFRNGLLGLGNSCFSRCTKLREVILPDSVREIELYAFSGCEKLKRIHFSKSLLSVGCFSFLECPELTELEIDADHPIFAIADGALYEKATGKIITYLLGTLPKEYEVPAGIKEIGESAFAACNGLISVFVHDNVRKIGKCAFSSCCNLEKAVIGKGIEEIASEAFADCSALRSVEINCDKLRILEQSIFSQCPMLETVCLPDSICEIKTDAFTGCDSLQMLELPAELVEISETAFDQNAMTILSVHSQKAEASCIKAKLDYILKTIPAEEIVPGTHLMWGSYPMEVVWKSENSVGVDIRRGIEWKVLDVKEDMALLISCYGWQADYMEDTVQNSTTGSWMTSPLRSWLNGEFWENAFSEEEQKIMSVTEMENGPGETGTTDRVFLLSREEVEQYMPSEADRICPLTRFVTWETDLDHEAFDWDGCGWWWLRSPGSTPDQATMVSTRGVLMSYPVDTEGGVIRPAIRLNLLLYRQNQ